MLIVDQLTKEWALSALADDPVELLGPIRLVLVFNRDAAFGLGGGLAPALAAAALVTVLVIVGRGDFLRHGPAAVTVGLVVGGAVGNLVDRALRDGGDGLLGGAVVDFVDVGPWPVFNVADSAIVVGAALLVLAARRAD